MVVEVESKIRTTSHNLVQRRTALSYVNAKVRVDFQVVA